MKILLNFLTLFMLSFGTSGQAASPVDAYPILSIPRSASADALLKYKLTNEEKKLFKEVDRECAKLPKDAELDAYHKVAVEIGGRYGLTPDQSIAFFTRTTFSAFEP